MLRPFASRYGFLGNVCFCLDRMARHAKQLQIAFGVLPTIDKRLDMIIGRTQFTLDGEGAFRALPTGPIKDADLNPRRNSLVIIGGLPFIDGPHSRISARLVAFSLCHSMNFMRMYSS